MSDARPALSVALSVYNGEAWLAEAIASVLAQTFTDFEFLILDDGSSDGSAAIIDHYARLDARIRCFRRDNRGLIASLNELLGHARAPLIARMDADDVCHPERFARQVAFLHTHADYGVVGCAEDYIDHGHRGRISSDLPLDHGSIRTAFAGGRVPISHPAVVYRRDLVLAAGGYRAAFRHCEDLDLWLRLIDSTRFANLPQVLLSYRRHPEQISRRHAFAQAYGAEVARLAWDERRAGRADPTRGLISLPPPDGLERLFGRDGTARALRARLLPGIAQGPASADQQAFTELLTHLAQGGARQSFWRLVPRLLVWGYPLKAARLALAMAGAGRDPARARRDLIVTFTTLVVGPAALVAAFGD